jgi:cytoskeletal protein RodZ
MEENVNSSGSKSKSVESVKLSRGATVAIVIGLLIMAFIIVCTFRGCSIQKNVNSDSKSNSTQTSTVENSESALNSTSNPVESGTISTVPQVTVTAPSENPKIENSTTPTFSNPTTSVDDGFSNVAEPVLSGKITTYGMVLKKSVYKKGCSYLYGVSLSVIINEQSVIVDYFCPRRTYEALSSGDSINVIYQLDSSGSISIYSISK